MKYFESKKRFLLSHANKAFHYVSLGDSIAAGHTINSEWESSYGYGSQYGADGNQFTAIVPDSYTDLIGKELVERYGDNISVTSFARSGDTVEDLMEKLSHDVVREAIGKADLVTLCIGANDILEPAMSELESYINYGDLSQLETIIESNLAVLGNDNEPFSYDALMKELQEINPSAQYVFTTVYNPYKYLWLEESTAQGNYKDGFFGPLMWAIPDAVGDTIANSIRSAFLNTDIVKTLFSRVNGLGAWAETYINRLNQILKSKASNYSNVYVADTKLLFDCIPDRPISADKHYNDLVSVEFTRDYNIDQVNWGQFWANVNWASILTDINSVANEVVGTIINDVIAPDVDPHPEWYGHYVLKRSFEDVLGWRSLTRYTLTYNANGGTGEMDSQEVVGVDNRVFAILKPNEFNPTAEGYYFNGWDNNATYFNGYYYVWLNSNKMVSAQWSNLYTLTFRHSRDVTVPTMQGSEHTGPQECYALWIAKPGENSVEQADLGAFSNSARVYTLPYGTVFGIVAADKEGTASSYITLNGNSVTDKSNNAARNFILKGNVDVNFEWNYRTRNVLWVYSYWNCYVTGQAEAI